MIADSDGNTWNNAVDYHIDQHTKLAENTQRQQLEDTVTQTLRERGANDNIIAAFKYHIGHESGWNPNLRQSDQPHWGGEANFAHGLLSEGGPEWEPMYRYASQHNTSWNDPRTQINFAIDNLQKSGKWNEMLGQSKEDAAVTMLKGYLRPAERFQVAREQAIHAGTMDKDPLGLQGGTGEMPYINPQTGRPHMSVTPSNYPSYENAIIDHSHDVPLIAGALMDNEGNVTGSAFSRLIPRYANIEGQTIDMFEGVHAHEMAEVKEMEENLLPSGMPSNLAYKQAHDKVATPTEENWARGKAKSLGVDPDKFWQSYQNHWKDMAKITENAQPEKVHPDLYLHPYHGHKFQGDVEKLSGRTIANHPFLNMAAPKGQQSINAALFDALKENWPAIKSKAGDTYQSIESVLRKIAEPIFAEHQRPFDVKRLMEVYGKAASLLRAPIAPETVSLALTRGATREAAYPPKIVEDPAAIERPTREKKRDKRHPADYDLRDFLTGMSNAYTK